MSVRDWLPTHLQAAGIDRVLAPGQRCSAWATGRQGSKKSCAAKCRWCVSMRAAERSSFTPQRLASCSRKPRCSTDLSLRRHHQDGRHRAPLPEGQGPFRARRNPQAAEAFTAILAREIMSLRTQIERAIFVPPAIEFATSSRSTPALTGEPFRCGEHSRTLLPSWGLPTRRCTRRWPAWPPKERSSGSRARLCSEASPSA